MHVLRGDPKVQVSNAEAIDDFTVRTIFDVQLTAAAGHRDVTIETSGGSFTLAGENLLLLTNYSGLDPEVNFAGQSNFSQADFLSQPQVRRFTARVNLTF